LYTVCGASRIGNYRRLYARTLAAGVNHFNQSQIVLNLLTTGAHTRAEDRAEENALITAALARLPPQRVFRLFEALRDRRVKQSPHAGGHARLYRWPPSRPFHS
jgi:hypothetical protein